jgi:hypothetical protein
MEQLSLPSLISQVALSAVADVNKVVVERIDAHQGRKVLEFPLDEQERVSK